MSMPKARWNESRPRAAHSREQTVVSQWLISISAILAQNSMEATGWQQRPQLRFGLRATTCE